jgi:endonuclease/exonuclease/phosphatase family metal-dependent hydrolase
MLTLTSLAASIILPLLGCHGSGLTRVMVDDHAAAKPRTLADAEALVGGAGKPALAAKPVVALAARSDVDPEIVGANDCLSVMSFNMHHRDRGNELAAMARDLRSRSDEIPDFILLQEVVFRGSNSKGEDNTAATLGNDLDYYCRGTKRSSDHEGIAILSRYPFAYYASRELEAQTSRALLGFNRVSVMAEFKVPDIGRVRVVNVHFTNWGFEERVRRKQLTETLQWAAQRQREVPADVIVFGGDFNIEPQWDELQLVFDTQVTGGIEYRNYNDPAALTFGSKGDPGKRVDYIFIAEPNRTSDLAHMSEECLWKHGVKLASSGKTFFPSDHLPVVHEYRVLNAAPAAAVAAAAP